MISRRTVLLMIIVSEAIIVKSSVAQDVAQYLQDISVTIRSGSSQGSGVIITREVALKDDTKQRVNFVWTAAHVIDNLRTVRTIVDSGGQEKKVVDFKPAYIVKELSERGRKVGELKIEAKVIKYSDSDNGEDLALLMIRKSGFVEASARFYLDGDMLLPIGEQLFHVGSLLGQDGANSMTSGILSQVGRVLELGASNTPIFDQTTVAAFPGSSGGGVFLASTGPNQGKYVGMLTRGAGETFNLVVPVRRIAKWASENNLRWAIDESVPCPSMEDIDKIPVEDVSNWFDKRNAPAVAPTPVPAPSPTVPAVADENETGEAITTRIK